MKNSFRTVILLFVLLFISAMQAFSIHEHDDEEKFFNQIEIKDGSELSVFDCVSTAFQHSPIIRLKKYNLDIAKSNVGVAKSQYFPTFSAGVGFFNENNSSSIYHDKHYREFPNVSVSLNQLIYNFGKSTAFIKMEEFYKIAAEYEFMDSLCATLFDIKDKYYKLLKAKALLESASDDVKISEYFIKISNKHPDK